MKIILSPSKTQNTNHLLQKKSKDLLNKQKTDNLFNILKRFSKEEIQSLMKIKNKLLDETYNNFQKDDSSSLTKEAIKVYQGVAFEQIKIDEYNQSQTKYLNQHLIILSAIYGALRPYTLISPYRLDMTMKPDGIHLYDYWQEDIIDLFKDEDYIIDLASHEYSRMLKPLKDKLLTIDFKEKDKDGKLKTISYNAKKARGKMVHQLTLNRVKTMDKIKTLVVDDYHYDPNQSSKNHFIFIKNND